MRAHPDRATKRATMPPELRRTVAVVMLGATLPFVDSTIVNVALHSLSAGLHAPLVRVQWVVTGYLLALAAVIPVTGWAARRMGPSRLYLLALACFTAGSALCMVSADLGMLVAARVLQGAGGGAILPVGTMIWAAQAGKARMARVMALIGVPIVAAPMLGPTLGGLLIAAAGWRAVFAVNVPVGVAGIVLAARLLPRTRGGRAGPLDLPGAVLAAAGTTGVTYGLVLIGGDARVTTAVLPALAIGLACLAGFVVRAARVRRPLLDVRLYTNRVFTAAAISSCGLGAAMFGGMILLPLYFQVVRGDSVIRTGMLLIPSGVGALLANRATAPLTDRFGSGVTALTGGLIGMAATVPLVFLGAHTSYPWLAVAMAGRGVGTGLALVPAMTAAYRALPAGKIADATPQLNIVQRVGGAVGTAALAVVLARAGPYSAGTPVAAAAAFGTAFAWVLALTAVATAPTLWLIAAERTARRRERCAPTAGKG